MEDINAEELNILRSMVLRHDVSIEKLDIIKLLKKGASERMRFFNQITFKVEEMKIPLERISKLIDSKVLYYVSESSRELSLTAKGHIVVKYNIMDLSQTVNQFLDDLNEGFYEDFQSKSKQKLNFEEKCTIITLMGILSFTESYSINIASLREKEDMAINRCLKKVSEFLSQILKNENPLIDKLSNNITEGKPAVTFFRRLDDIQVKTESIYFKSGGRHYLNILTDQRVDQDKLSFLLRRIFDNRTLNFEERSSLVSLLKEIEEERIPILGNSTDFKVTRIKSELAFNVKDYKS
jgi:hypothetical protein